MRIVGLDLGERRIGVAAADSRTRVAVPVTTLRVAGDPLTAIVSLVREQGADELVVGLPLSLSGALGPQGQQTMEMVEALRATLSIPVHTWDERLTTVQASRIPRDQRRSRSRRSAAAGRDAAAAAILLQAYLDSLASYPPAGRTGG